MSEVISEIAPPSFRTIQSFSSFTLCPNLTQTILPTTHIDKIEPKKHPSQHQVKSTKIHLKDTFILCTDCYLISGKERNLVVGCPHKFGKSGVSLSECKGYLSQNDGNAINYDPTRGACNIKTCEDENDARSKLAPYKHPYDVYYCDRE